jgi:predicted TIM-barrel fold metal-dependent hydrolase
MIVGDKISSRKIIDAVVNLQTPEALKYRPSDRKSFYIDKMNVDPDVFEGLAIEKMLNLMDKSNVAKAFLIAAKIGQIGLPGSYHLPYEVVYKVITDRPDRFCGLAGIDPTEGMTGVRELERAVKDFGFIGAHSYPHWFELAPDHRKFYPFYAKCVDLDIPVQIQVGQSLIYSLLAPKRSTGRPISLDTVACDFPDLKIIGIHIGIPWHDEMIAMAWKHSNVYIGCDAHAPKYWPDSFIKYLSSYGQDKVIFGTDFPVIDFARATNEILNLGLKDSVLDKLFWINVNKVYNL